MAAGYKLTSVTKNVASAGTAERLTAAMTLTHSVEIAARDSNTGDVYIGDSTIDNTATGLSAGESMTVSAPLVRGNQGELDLTEIFVDADTNGEGVNLTYVSRVN